MINVRSPYIGTENIDIIIADEKHFKYISRYIFELFIDHFRSKENENKTIQ